MHLDDPTFPPLLNGVAVKGADAFEAACAAAAAGEAQAGDVFWARDTARFAAAIVLEPEVDAATAMQMHYTSMVALGDAFGAIAPAEIGIFYRWPFTLMVNGAQVGHTSLCLPADVASSEQPGWLVVGAEIVLRSDRRMHDPGEGLERTALEFEGCGDVDRTQLVEAYCRHFLVWLHTWQEDGFRAVHDMWIGRVEQNGEKGVVAHEGGAFATDVLGLDEAGNLLVKTDDGTKNLSLLAAAARL